MLQQIFEGPIVTFIFIALGIGALVYFTVLLSLFIPFVVARDEIPFFGKRYLNIAYAIISFFLPLLSLLYIFIVRRDLLKYLYPGLFCFLGAVVLFLLRALVQTYYMRL
jgi:hypothetical protein